jgi:hypothetical protein
MADKLFHVKEFYEGFIYPAMTVATAMGPIMPPEQLWCSSAGQAFVQAYNYLAGAILGDDPAWRYNDPEGAPTEAADDSNVKSLVVEMLRDKEGILRVAPYSTGMTPEQQVVLGLDSEPPGDCFLTRLIAAVQLDDPEWTV